LHELVTGSVRSDIRQTLAFYSKDASVLGAWWDFQALCTVETWHVNSCPQSGLSKADGDNRNQIVSVALQEFVRFYSDVAIEVSSWSASSAGFALVGGSYTLSFVDARWDFDIDASFFGYFAGAFAFFAGACDDLPAASTLRTGRDHLEEAASSRDLAGSAACVASAGFCSFSTAGAAAFEAYILPCEFDGFFSALSDIVKR